MSARAILALLMVLACWPTFAQVRNWTDRQGNTLRAELVRVHNGQVVLLRGGRTTQIPLVNLSEQDQQYVQQRLNGEMPAKAPEKPEDATQPDQ